MQYRIKYVLLSHGQRDDVHSRAVVAPITHAIQLKLSTQFRDLHRDEQIRLYKYFERMSESRKVAGIFYEAIVQSYLQDGRLLELVPMVTLEGTMTTRSKEEPQHQWHSSHMTIDHP